MIKKVELLTGVCINCLFTGIKNVAFFFSAVSAQSRKERRGKQNANGEDAESDDESTNDVLTSSQVASTTSQDWLSNYPTVANDKLHPTVNYWIALTTPNGAPANIHQALLECGVETMANQVHNCLM